MNWFNSRNRAIVREMVGTDFKVRYQGSVLGYLWSLLRPLLLFAVLFVIFVYIIPLGKGIEHYPVYLLTGVILWSFFNEATTQGILSVVSRGDLIRKVSIPRYLLVISSSISALINLGLSLVVLFIFALLDGIAPSIGWLVLLPVMLELYILVLGISFLLSTFYVKYRDVSYIWEVFLQVGFYASAIVFPISLVPVEYRSWFLMNPIAQIVQDARYIIATKDTITLWSTVHSWAAIIPFLIIAAVTIYGGVCFKRRSKFFAEDV